jgi:hypothetical protein
MLSTFLPSQEAPSIPPTIVRVKVLLISMLY